MARLRRVQQGERLDLVLEDVREGEQASLARVDPPDFLDAVITAKYPRDPFLVVLRVPDPVRVINVALLAEGQAARCDIGTVVVV